MTRGRKLDVGAKRLVDGVTNPTVLAACSTPASTLKALWSTKRSVDGLTRKSCLEAEEARLGESRKPERGIHVLPGALLFAEPVTPCHLAGELRMRMRHLNPLSPRKVVYRENRGLVGVEHLWSRADANGSVEHRRQPLLTELRGRLAKQQRSLAIVTGAA